MRESVIENYLRNKAILNHYMCLKFVSPGQIGVPDRILIGHGRVLFVETKAPGEQPRKAQEYVFNKMRKHGAIVLVADTKEKVDQLFESLKNKEI